VAVCSSSVIAVLLAAVVVCSASAFTLLCDTVIALAKLVPVMVLLVLYYMLTLLARIDAAEYKD
jgi:ABC-type amino acid transport system permease subunit